MVDAFAFYPSPPERAKTLSSEQVRRFDANGFVDNILSAGQVSIHTSTLILKLSQSALDPLATSATTVRFTLP